MRSDKGTVSPEEYIERLKDLRRKANDLNHQLERGIFNMESRLETGYTYLEGYSKINLSNARGLTETINNELKKLCNIKIKY